MCASHLHWRRERTQSFRTTKLFNGNHTVEFCRDFTENRLRAVCTCGWSASVYANESIDKDPISEIRAKASEHLMSRVEVADGGILTRKPDL